MGRFSSPPFPLEAGTRPQYHPKPKAPIPAIRKGHKRLAASARLKSASKISNRRYMVPEAISMLPAQTRGACASRARFAKITVVTVEE